MKDQEIDGVLDNAGRAPQDLAPEVLQRLADSIKPTLRPVRPLPPPWVMTCGLLLISAAVSLAGAAHAGFFGFEKMDILERLLIFPALAILVWMAGSEFVHAMIPGSLRRISSGALLGFGTTALLIVFAFLFRDYRIDHFFSAGIACLLVGFLHAIPAALLSWLLLRRGFAVNSVSAGLAAGTLGGLAGVGMLELHCPNFQAAHVLAWHVAVVPISGAAGALAAWTLRFWAGSRRQARISLK
ncbi:MAG: NrsF family protein [Terracidiphilus sp.]